MKCQDFGPTQLKEHENLIFVGLISFKKKNYRSFAIGPSGCNDWAGATGHPLQILILAQRWKILIDHCRTRY